MSQPIETKPYEEMDLGSLLQLIEDQAEDILIESDCPHAHSSGRVILEITARMAASPKFQEVMNDL